MKFVIAPDSFKNSLAAKQAATAIYRGFLKIFPTAHYELVPMADGGEGTVQSLVDATGGRLITCQVHGPLDSLVEVHYGLLADHQTAVIEMAEASGLQYVNQKTRDPLTATTFGTGELILQAADQGAKKIMLGIGGSATNDGGAGMAEALGVKLLDQNNRPIPHGGGFLDRLDHFDFSNYDHRLDQIEIIIAADVKNPLTGKNGASRVFGRQKGATESMIAKLDQNLQHYAAIIKRDLKKDVEFLPGAGAAGGLGAGLLAFTNCRMEKGIDLVIEYSGLTDKTVGADFCITGEGKIDFQTKFGKTPYGVAQAVKKVSPQATVIALVGTIGQGIEELYQSQMIDAIFSITNGSKTLKQALNETAADLEQTAYNTARLIKKIDDGRQNKGKR